MPGPEQINTTIYPLKREHLRSNQPLQTIATDHFSGVITYVKDGTWSLQIFPLSKSGNIVQTEYIGEGNAVMTEIDSSMYENPLESPREQIAQARREALKQLRVLEMLFIQAAQEDPLLDPAAFVVQQELHTNKMVSQID